VSAQYQLIDKLVRSANGGTRRGLLRVGAAYAALIGWLYQDVGDMDGAAFWRGVTQEIATPSRDRHLIGYSLDDAGSLLPEARIVAMPQQAHGASLTGDRRSVDQLIDAADGLLSRMDDDLPAEQRVPTYARLAGGPAGHLLRQARPKSGVRRAVGPGPPRRPGNRPP
jgi:hypothetical protein